MARGPNCHVYQLKLRISAVTESGSLMSCAGLNKNRDTGIKFNFALRCGWRERRGSKCGSRGGRRNGSKRDLSNSLKVIKVSGETWNFPKSSLSGRPIPCLLLFAGIKKFRRCCHCSCLKSDSQNGAIVFAPLPLCCRSYIFNIWYVLIISSKIS